jgi:hypothetical protein
MLSNGSSLILYGQSKDITLRRAYDLAIDYLVVGSDMQREEVEKHVYAGTYQNFMRLKKAEDKNEIAVDDSRSIIEFLSLKKCLPGNRVVIIESAEDMSRNAANSILKTLEEPPEDASLILTTSRFFSILPTIRSRCFKLTVKSEQQSIFNFQDPIDYVKATFPDVDQKLIERTVLLLQSGGKSLIEFSKQYADSMTQILDIMISYFYVVCLKTGSAVIADVLLNLCEFANLSSYTYPDKQSVIISAFEFLNKNDLCFQK